MRADAFYRLLDRVVEELQSDEDLAPPPIPMVATPYGKVVREDRAQVAATAVLLYGGLCVAAGVGACWLLFRGLKRTAPRKSRQNWRLGRHARARPLPRSGAQTTPGAYRRANVGLGAR